MNPVEVVKGRQHMHRSRIPPEPLIFSGDGASSGEGVGIAPSVSVRIILLARAGAPGRVYAWIVLENNVCVRTRPHADNGVYFKICDVIGVCITGFRTSLGWIVFTSHDNLLLQAVEAQQKSPFWNPCSL